MKFLPLVGWSDNVAQIQFLFECELEPEQRHKMPQLRRTLRKCLLSATPLSSARWVFSNYSLLFLLFALIAIADCK